MSNNSNFDSPPVASTGRSMLQKDNTATGRGHVTIVMYHYVRPLKRTRFPEIKGLDLEDFQAQIEYIDRHYEVITLPELIAAIDGEHALPENAALLTFDDGYADHYDYAMPILDEYGMSGIFFPPVNVVRERRVLDVNKIHFVLASGINIHDLIEQIHGQLEHYRDEYDLPSERALFGRYATANRFDPKEVVYVKRLLQKGLPEKVRSEIVDALFTENVTQDEKAFGEELYMTEDQLKYALRNDFHVGAHGVEHVWLDAISFDEKEREISESKDFLLEMGIRADQLTLAYPYGGWDDEVRRLLQQHRYRMGFTVKVGAADIGTGQPFLLSRYDAKDLYDI